MTTTPTARPDSGGQDPVTPTAPAPPTPAPSAAVADRQEKQPARTDVTEVAPDVVRMQLPIALPGLSHVNTYAILDRNGAAIIDPGLPGPTSWKHLMTRMKAAGLEVRHVHTVLVTHSHPDHFGNAGKLAKEAGAELVTHRAFRTWWSPDTMCSCTNPDCEDPKHAHPDHEQEDLPADAPWGAPTPWGPAAFKPSVKRSFVQRMIKVGSGKGLLGRIYPTANPSRRVRHNEELKLGGRVWYATHTPGHTVDHLCIYDPEHGVVFTGDHVLPTITPHIGAIANGTDPLRDFFASLERIGELPKVKRALPAHGLEINDVHTRLRDIRDHHHERFRALHSVSSALGAVTVQEFSRHLFRRERWGHMAESETFVHLIHLHRQGKAERHPDRDGHAVYEVHAA